MATDVRPPLADFDPASFEAFRFVACDLDASGGDATRIQRTAAVAAVPRLVAARRLDPVQRAPRVFSASGANPHTRGDRAGG
jgi:hypothetical protein